MEWDPEPHDQGPFWPGQVERRRPRWLPIVVATAAVAVVVGAAIWLLGGGDQDSGSTAASVDGAEEAAGDVESEAQTGDGVSGDGQRAGGTSTTTTTTTTSAATTTVEATTTTITTVPPEDPGRFGPATLGPGSTVSTVGLDTVHFGMTVIQAQEAAGTVLVPAGPTGGCYHAVPFDAPEGIVFLIHQGTVERVEINSGPITTRSGVGVGSPESLVIDLFGDSIEREVRIDGTVDLVFVPNDPGDQDYRVVFNVSEGSVRAFKSGRLPQVMLDTGCESQEPESQ